jgi:TetR/AcrR family transcriptional repressor of bet genes
MPKVGMEPYRRAEAINAALECICEHGIDRITLDMVAAKAGFSKGIVSYYFKSKKQLIVESLKAFLLSYQLKIQNAITKEMQPLQMLKTIIETSLPPINDDNHGRLNVSNLGGPDKINLPEDKIAKIFIQFLAKIASDDELKIILKEVYSSDIEGISSIMLYAKKSYNVEKIDENKAAYGLLAMIYGLSFFRSAGFMPLSENDNREIAFDFIDTLFLK